MTAAPDIAVVREALTYWKTETRYGRIHAPQVLAALDRLEAQMLRAEAAESRVAELEAERADRFVWRAEDGTLLRNDNETTGYQTHSELEAEVARLMQLLRLMRERTGDYELHPYWKEEIAAALAEKTTPKDRECTGAWSCTASPHIHGCYADRGDCDRPGEHRALAGKDAAT